MPNLTVIVCTHNRASFLDQCLAGLAAQEADRSSYGVLVVDNASSDQTRSVFEKHAAANPGLFSYHFESKLGLAAARNSGLALIDTPLVAYTDDDAIPFPTWVDKIQKRFEQLPEDVVLLGGEIEPIWEIHRPAWLSDEMLRPLSARLGWADHARMLRAREWVCEVNCCYRSEKLREYGGFPEALGRKGDLLLSGENYVNEQMSADGLRVYYDPEILVKHFIPKARISKNWLLRRSFWQGITGAVCAEFDRENGRVPEHWQNVRLPSSSRDWLALLDPGELEPIEYGCELAMNLGYVLGVKNLVIGR